MLVKFKFGKLQICV